MVPVASRFVLRTFGVLLLAGMVRPNIAAAPVPGAALLASKAFSGPTVAVGSLTTLTFSITNNSGATVTNVNFTDTLPAGLLIATPNGTAVAGCTFASVIAASGTNTITGGPLTIPNLTTCTVAVNLVGVTAGVQNNTSSTVTSSLGGSVPAMTASITVVSPPLISKAFGVSSVTTGSGTTLTFTVTNANTGTALTGVGFTDTFPAGIIIATPNGLVGSCGGGTITATAAAGSVSLAGATLAATTSCTFTVNVTTTSPGAKINTTSAVTSNEGGLGNTATATLTVNAPVPLTGPLMLGLLAVLMLAMMATMLRRRSAGVA